MKKSIIYLFSMLFIFSLAACKDSDENKTPDVAKFSEFSGDYLGSLMLSGNDALKNINVKIEGTDGVEKLKITLSKFKPETRAEIESVTFEAPAVIEGGKCKFEATNVEFASLKNMTLIGEIANKEIFIDGSYINEAGETVKLSFEGALDKEAEVEEATNFADFSGDYLGNLGFSEDQILKNINLNVVGVNGVKELTLTFSKLTNAADFEPVTVTVPARIEEGKCVFTVKDLAIGTLLNVELEGVIADKVLKLEGTSTIEGETVNLSFEGEIGKDANLDFAAIVGNYEGALFVTEMPIAFSTAVSIEEGVLEGGLIFQFKDVDFGFGNQDYTMNIPASFDGDACVVNDAPILIEGLENAVLNARITSKEVFLISINGVTLEGKKIEVRYKIASIVERSLGAYTFDEPFEQISKFIMPKTEGLFKWSSSDLGLKSISPKRYSVSQEEGFKGQSVAVQTFATKYIASGFIASFAPRVTAGSLFLGNFNLNPTKPLASTKFGVMMESQITKVKGYYKYVPGKDFHVASDSPTIDMVDEFSIAAVLYEVEKEADTLDGYNINTSDKIVAFQKLTGGLQDTFKEFELVLDYVKDFDFSKKYKFAIVISASKDGDKYHGAHESKLWVDELEVFGKVIE